MTAPTQHRVLAAAAGLGSAAVVLALSAAGLLAGGGPGGAVGSVLGAVLLVAAWTLVPTGATLSRRLAVNGVLALGIVPLLWWIPFPEIGGATRLHLVLAVVVGAIAAWVTLRGPRRLLPIVSLVDAVPPAVGVASALALAPLLTVARGIPAVAVLRQAYGNDDVAHFFIFETTRRLGVAGPWWNAGRTGDSRLPYSDYPAQFHSMAAALAGVLGSPRVSSVGEEVRLFEMCGGLLLVVGMVVCAAAIVSIPELRRRPGLALIAAAGAFSVLLYGFGSTSLRYGFAPFQWGTILAVTTVAVALGRRYHSVLSLAAIVAGAAAVALSWTLAAPMVAVAAAVGLLRMRWAARPGRRLRIAGAGAIVLVGLLAGAAAIVLNLRSASALGGPYAALDLGGDVQATPVGLLGAAVAVGLAAALVLRVIPGDADRDAGAITSLTVGGTVAVTGAEVVAITASQMRSLGDVNYYAIKVGDAAAMIAVPVAVVGAALVASALLPRIPRSGLVSALIAAAMILASGVPVAPGGFAPALAPSSAFAASVGSAASGPTAATALLLRAVRTRPPSSCRRTTYLTSGAPRARRDVQAQWYRSLSGSWTLGDAGAAQYLYATRERPLASVAAHLLASTAGGCLVVSSGDRSLLPAALVATAGDRIVTASP